MSKVVFTEDGMDRCWLDLIHTQCQTIVYNNDQRMECSTMSFDETSNECGRPASKKWLKRVWYKRDVTKVQRQRLDKECRRCACQRSTDYKKPRPLPTQFPCPGISMRSKPCGLSYPPMPSAVSIFSRREWSRAVCLRAPDLFQTTRVEPRLCQSARHLAYLG